MYVIMINIEILIIIQTDDEPVFTVGNKNLMLPVKTLFLPERELFFDPLLRA